MDASGPSGREFAEGIVFVHGIGSQTRGQALTEFAEALGTWLQRWITNDPGADLPVGPEDGGRGVAISESVVDDPSDSVIPAHAVLTLRGSDNSDRRVLVAESWWAEAFEPPRLRQLAQWIAVIAPRLVFSHLGTPLRRSYRQFMRERSLLIKVWIVVRAVPEIAIFLTSFVWTPLLILLLGLILAPALIPIPQLQQIARSTATRLVAYLGDSFVVTMSPFRRDLITRVVERDIAWMCTKCASVSVVAHSQGAVLTHDALRRSRPANVRMLITLGAGIEKLLRLRLAYRETRWVFAYQWTGALGGIGVAVAILFAIHQSANNHATSTAIAVGVAGAFAALMGVNGVVALWQDDEGDYARLLRLPTHALGSGFRWINLYASSDPVPNGPLLDTPHPLDRIEEYEVSNHASIASDHTSYLRNCDEVLPLLARNLIPNVEDLRPDTQPPGPKWSPIRRVRIETLAFGRATIAMSAVVATWIARGRFDDIGRAVTRRLTGWPHGPLHLIALAVPGHLGSPARGVVAWIGGWLSLYVLLLAVVAAWGRCDVHLVYWPVGGFANDFRLFRGSAAGIAVTLMASAVIFTSTLGVTDSVTFALWTALGVALVGATASLILRRPCTRMLGRVAARVNASRRESQRARQAAILARLREHNLD